MRIVSLNTRLMQDTVSSGEIHAILFEINHPALDAPVRLSTDNTERLSVDPLYYGTRSTWRGANPVTDPYLWVVASALLPSDKEDAPAAGTLLLENLDRDMVRVVRSFTDLATIHMAVVLADSPNVPDLEYVGMEILSADIDNGIITLTFGRENIEKEPVPVDRFSRNLFPGLFL